MTGMLAIGALRTLAAENLRPGELLARLNRQIMEAQHGGFVTCVAARLTPDGELTIANAGHLEPYRNGLEIACNPGLPLGLDPSAGYEDTAIQTMAGDRVTFLSDGIVEARSGKGDLLGFERTRELSTRAAEEIAAEALHFGQEDDITVLTLAAELRSAAVESGTAPAGDAQTVPVE
jgi:serine phosphatase RsbU (regulator of sigma subunit)